MNKLNELIHKLCPNGVEYMPLETVCKIEKGVQFNKTDMCDEGTYPVINGGIKPSGYIEQYNQNENTITISQGGASAGYVNWLQTKFWAGAHCYVLKPTSEILDRYLFHFLKSKEYKLQECQYGAGIPALGKSTVASLIVPVPPLPVQEEIVRILDRFTAVTDKLALELALELAARKKQLTYYREKMINQGNITVKLAEICDIFLGLTATPNYTDSGVKFISAQNTSNDYLDLERVKYISEEDFRKATSNAKPQRGDVLFTRVGSNLGHPVIVDTDERLCIFVSLGFLRIKEHSLVLNRYLRHWMNTDLFWDQVRKNVHGAAKVNLNTGWLKDFEIPLLPIERQQDVCEFLEHLEEMCSNLTTDLKLELETRKKQYSFYRNRLLTFKELNVQ